jgi:hypothetical protein
MEIKISEIEQGFKDIFEVEDGVVNTVESVYEMSLDEKFYKLVISIHGLSTQDTSIIHTKFIFKTDLDKRNIIDNSFIYLYDINCIYHKMEFTNVLDMKKKIEDIVESKSFGEDLQILSDFIEAPSMFLNYYMRRSKITDYSIFDVEYEPKFKTAPCDKVTFDFKININNNYHMELSIQKIDRPSDDKEDNVDIYKFQFKFMDEIETFETDTIKNVHFFIGDHIAKILDRKLKNK